MSKSNCLFCLTDRIRVPCYYKENCFRCNKQPGKPGCHSIQRYCLLCIRRHLELDKPRNQRSESVKCPLCPAVTNPRILNQEYSYEPDYRMMADDTTIDYPCFHDENGCEFVGSQTDLHAHMMKCEYSTTSCMHCGAYFMARLRTEHEAVCPLMSNCPLCPMRILTSKLREHCLSCHDQSKCIHCSHWISTNEIDIHQTQLCPLRIIRCAYCPLNYKISDKSTHLHRHLTEIEISVGQVAHQLQDLQRRMFRVLKDMSDE